MLGQRTVERADGIDPPVAARLERGWRAALAYVLRREHLRRTVRITLVVGAVLTTVNQLDMIVRGDATAITWIKSGTNYVIPSSSPTWGCSAGTLARPEGPH